MRWHRSLVLALLALLILPVVPAAAQFDTQFRVGYKAVRVHGETDKWILHLKVVNKKAVWDVWAFEIFLDNAVGTSEFTQPDGWQGNPTVGDEGEEPTGALFSTLSDDREVAPGKTQAGFSWKVCSTDPPKLKAVSLVHWEHVNNTSSSFELVKVREDLSQTESSDCEAPDTHGFTQETTLPGTNFEVVPDTWIHQEDCAIATGDVVGAPGAPYTTTLLSPVLDLSTHFDPVVEFTHLFSADPDVTATVSASPDGGGTWLELASYGGCPDPPSCEQSGRVTLSASAVGGMSSAVVRWEFLHPTGMKAPATGLSFWVLDDLLILGDELPEEPVSRRAMSFGRFRSGY